MTNDHVIFGSSAHESKEGETITFCSKQIIYVEKMAAASCQKIKGSNLNFFPNFLNNKFLVFFDNFFSNNYF